MGLTPGTVREFDEASGLGLIVDDEGVEYVFQCIEIADGSRTIDAGVPVTFEVLPRLGRYQAARIVKG